MQPRSLTSLSIALLFAGGVSASAQAAGSWIDPPAQTSPAPSTPSAQAAPSPAEPAPAPRAAPRSEPRTPLPRQAEPRRPEPAPPIQSAEPRRAPAPAAPAPVERPRRTAEPARKPVVPAPEVVEQRPPERRGSANRVAAAEALATMYLQTWSEPNGLTLDSTTDFYAPRVRFHGRVMSARELLQEKRRFVQRWPERAYRPRFETMGTACAARGATCTVRSVFDFSAANPAAGRRSQGIGTLELVVSFAGNRPMIAAENSIVLGRARGQQRSALEADDE